MGPQCLPSPVSLSPPASPWPPCVPSAPPQCRPCTPPPPSLTLTPQRSSSVQEPPPWVLLDLEQELDQCSGHSSLDTPGTPHSSSSSSLMLFWDSLCPRPWVCSA